MRCRVTLPIREHSPRSEDPAVSDNWGLPRRDEGYERVVASWRAQSPLAVALDVEVTRIPVEDDTTNEIGETR